MKGVLLLNVTVQEEHRYGRRSCGADPCQGNGENLYPFIVVSNDKGINRVVNPEKNPFPRGADAAVDVVVAADLFRLVHVDPQVDPLDLPDPHTVGPISIARAAAACLQRLHPVDLVPGVLDRPAAHRVVVVPPSAVPKDVVLIGVDTGAGRHAVQNVVRIPRVRAVSGVVVRPGVCAGVVGCRCQVVALRLIGVALCLGSVFHKSGARPSARLHRGLEALRVVRSFIEPARRVGIGRVD